MPDILKPGDLLKIQSSSGMRICTVLEVCPWPKSRFREAGLITLGGFLPAPDNILALLQPLYEELTKRESSAPISTYGWISNNYKVLIDPDLDKSTKRFNYKISRL